MGNRRSKRGGLATLALMGLVACTAAPKQGDGSRAGARTAADAMERELPIPSVMQEQVRKSELVGRILYVLDHVSAVATDVLTEAVPDFREKNLAGYLPFQEADDDGRPKTSYVVSFFTKEEPIRVAYEIRVQPRARPVLAAFDPPKLATDAFARFAKAREAAIAALSSYPQPLNPIALPAGVLGEKGIMVFLIAGTTKPNVAVFGRHYRVLVPEQGGPPTYVMPLSNSVLELPTKSAQGGETVALVVSHLLTDWPLETHVFASLLSRKRVYVKTRVGVWRVDGDKVALVDHLPWEGRAHDAGP